MKLSILAFFQDAHRIVTNPVPVHVNSLDKERGITGRFVAGRGEILP